MSGYIRVTVSNAPPTRLGTLDLAGEVSQAEPAVPRSPLRVEQGFILSLVTAGHGEFRTADGSAPIGPRSLTIVPPGQPHWYGPPRGQRWDEWFAVFRGPLFETLQAAAVLDDTGPRPLPRSASVPELTALLAVQPRGQQAAEHQLMALADWLTSARPAEPGERSVWTRAAEQLTQDLAGGLDLHRLAADLGLGYDAFRRGFTRELGRPPLAYRNERRLESAALLLRLTSLSIRQIAEQLGYSDEFHLSRRFRARYRTPPSSYRRDHG